MGCSETTVGAGDELLVAVVEVREIPAEAGGVGLHVGERVVVFAVAEFVEAEAVGVVGIDGDETKTAAAEIVAKFLETFFDAVGRGAVIRGEEDHEHIGSGEVREFVRAAVDAGESKIGGGVADGESARTGGVAGFVEEGRTRSGLRSRRVLGGARAEPG